MRQMDIDLGNSGASTADPNIAITGQFEFTEKKGINMRTFGRGAVIVAGCMWASASPATAQSAAPGASTAASSKAPASSSVVAVPPGYVIGPEDQLSVVFWRDKDLSSDVVVRPDGKISLPLLNDVQAGGLTPEELRRSVTEEAKRFVEDPTASVIVREIHSRKVFVTGLVAKPGTYSLAGPTTVLQLLATAGGLQEYADKENIVILRQGNGTEVAYKFNYKDVVRQKNPGQNIALKPGDTVVVP